MSDTRTGTASGRTNEPISVLLIEDDANLAGLTRDVLTSARYVVEVVGTGGAAIERLEADGNFDVAIVDLGLPDMNGADVARHLSERHPETAILVATGSLVKPEIQYCGWLTKPYYRRDLVSALNAALLVHRRRAQRPSRPTHDTGEFLTA
jgi:DNA-binding response OmpR family regulator